MVVDREIEGQKLSNGVREKNGVFYVPSSVSGISYRFDNETMSCTCPDRIFRKNHCKHELALFYYIKNKDLDKVLQYKDILDYIISLGGKIKYYELLKEFGDRTNDALDIFKKTNEIIEKHGEIILLR
jgi:hypothetical protein